MTAYYDDGYVKNCWAGGSPCGPGTVLLQPPLPWWAHKLLVYLPYPVLDDGSHELPCFGP